MFARSKSIAPLSNGTRLDARIMRLDGRGAGWADPRSGQGSLRDGPVWSDFSAGERLDAYTIREILRANALGHRICWREAEDATKDGWEVRGEVKGVPLENDPEQQKAWASWFGKLDLRGQIVQARGMARAFGGAAWVLQIDDGRRSDQPVDWSAIKSIRWIRTIRGGRHSLVQPLEVETETMSTRFLQPRLYNVSFPEGPAGVFHWQRVVIWQGEVTDGETLVENNGWGESVLDRVWTALRQHGASYQWAMAALSKLSQGVFKSQYLAEAIASGNAQQAKEKLESVAMGMSILGDMAIGNNEEYDVIGRPLQASRAC